MSKITFKVQKIGSFYFLMVDGADTSFTCCVSARLQLENVKFFHGDEADKEEFSFCVECKQIMYSIDNPAYAHACLTIEGHSNTARIHLLMSDPDQPNSTERAELSTFVDADPPQGLCPLDFNMLLEIDLNKLRGLVKQSRKARAEHLSIYVCTNSKGPKQYSLVMFYLEGDTQHTQSFYNEMTKHEDGSLIVRAAADTTNTAVEFDDESDIAFQGTFPIEKIDAFVKNIPVRMIVAKLKNGMPLMLTHHLGSGEDEESHVRFLVAPKSDEY